VTLKLWHKVALPVKQEELFYQIWTSCNLLLSSYEFGWDKWRDAWMYRWTATCNGAFYWRAM